MIRRKLTCITDPGHGWLSVSHKDLIALDIVDKISTFSYMNHTRSFLEEDCDAGTYLDAAKRAGWKVELKTSTNKRNYNACSSVRSLSRFKPYFVRNPIKVGDSVYLYNPEQELDEYKVTEEGRYWIVSNAFDTYDYNRYRLTKSNPYAAVYYPTDS